MKISSGGIATFCTVVSLGLAGCGAGSSASTEARHEGVTVDLTPTKLAAGSVLATLKTPEGHTFVFGRSERGDLVVAENAPVGEAPVLAEAAGGGSISELFTRLSGGVPAPDSLVKAEAVKPAVHPVKAPSEPPHQDILVHLPPPQLTATQQWFESSFCAPTLSYMTICDVTPTPGSINTSQGQWIYASNYYSYALNDPSNTSTGAMLEFVWNGSGWGLDWASSAIAPGTYWYQYWYNSAPVYRSSELALQGIGGMTSGGISNDGYLYANYDSGLVEWTFDVDTVNAKAEFPNDAQLDCYVQGVWISSFSTTVKGITHSVESHCPPCEDAQCVGDTWSVECQGHTTHQSVSTSTTTNYFSTANCSAESPPNG